MTKIAFAADTFYHHHYDVNQLSSAFQRVKAQYDTKNLRRIFSYENLNCDIKVFEELQNLDQKDIKFAILLAAERRLIDPVETEILIKKSFLYEKIRVKRADSKIRFRKSLNSLRDSYKKLTNKSTCMEKNWNEFKSKVVVKAYNANTPGIDTYDELNKKALRRRMISKQDYKLLKLLREVEQINILSIPKYRKKKEKLEKLNYSINSEVTRYHIDSQKIDTDSLRYSFYKKYNAQQTHEMLNLITTLIGRTQSDKTKIIFIDANGNISEAKELGPMEQLHLSLKLYQQEKQNLLDTEAFKGTSFSYKELITAAFELSQITTLEAESLSMFERKIKEKKLWKKGLELAKRMDYIVTVLTSPVGGLVYALSIGIANQYLNPPDQSPDYKQSLFYGNCEMNL